MVWSTSNICVLCVPSHVPPFSAVLKDVQLAFARDLIECIAAQILGMSCT
jgi:hypothetical protein